MNSQVQYINPEGLSVNPVFTQVVTTSGSGTTIYIDGQDTVNGGGEIVGKGDIAAQTEQVLKNLQIALTACGATFENLVKLSIYVVKGHDMRAGFQASQKYLGNLKHPPALSVLIVSGLANPEFLVEMEATAFIPE